MDWHVIRESLLEKIRGDISAADSQSSQVRRADEERLADRADLAREASDWNITNCLAHEKAKRLRNLLALKDLLETEEPDVFLVLVQEGKKEPQTAVILPAGIPNPYAGEDLDGFHLVSADCPISRAIRPLLGGKHVGKVILPNGREATVTPLMA